MERLPNRANLLWLSALDCVFGLIYLSAHGGLRGLALALNFFLAIYLAVQTARDLERRGVGWPAVAVGFSYLLAPLIGLLLYLAASNRPLVTESDPAL